MGKQVKSARGEIIDFDLLKIKEQIASAPPSTDVKARQDFIDKRLRRRIKKAKPPAPKVAPVEVTPELPKTEEVAVEAESTPEPKTTKQKARK